MADTKDTGDEWFQERFGRAPAQAAPPSRHVLWYGGVLLVALILLGSFYMVLNQSMARAHQHWSQASQGSFGAGADACAAGNAARQSCASGSVEPVSLRDGSAARLATGR